MAQHQWLLQTSPCWYCHCAALRLPSCLPPCPALPCSSPASLGPPDFYAPSETDEEEAMSRDMIQRGYWEVVPGIKVRSQAQHHCCCLRPNVIYAADVIYVLASPCDASSPQGYPARQGLEPLRSIRSARWTLSLLSPLPALMQDAMEYRSLSEPESASLWSPENLARLRKVGPTLHAARGGQA